MSPDSTPDPKPTRGAADEPAPERRRPGALSEQDPTTESGGRSGPPLMLIIIIVLAVTAFVALHLAGVFGPGSH